MQKETKNRDKMRFNFNLKVKDASKFEEHAEAYGGKRNQVLEKAIVDFFKNDIKTKEFIKANYE